MLTGPYASLHGDRFGAFMLQGPCGAELTILADDGFTTRWEHVSASTVRRPPNWQEMCFVKNLFWDETEAVVQFHPPRAQYVNCHPHCLHMWKPPYELQLPPSFLVGPR